MVADMTSRLFEGQLRLLRQTYIQQLQTTVAELELLHTQINEQQSDSTTFKSLRHTMHGLAGSGATYGFSAISEQAGRLDRYVQTLIEHHEPPSAIQRTYVIALLGDVCETIRLHAHAAAPTIEFAIPTPSAKPELATRQIVVYDADPLIAEDIARQISNFGYAVSVYTNQAAMQREVTTNPPDAVISELIAVDDILSHLRNAGGNPIPLIVTAPDDDFTTRLKAVRAGGAAFLTKPVDTGALIDLLDGLTSAREIEPYRILIIDDQPLLAATYATTLRQAGMFVTTVTNPLRVMASLGDFQPDVLLLDMYMPGCTGIELATVLRQQAAYVGIPIVFLSAETQLDRQMEALKRGGDDFLTKPIQLDHLVAAVANRAQRARLLRSAMVRDSLTGLYNHTTSKELLNREFARAIRSSRTLTFAMVDIDRFKSVNDTYGHVIGDHVIKSLARLLQQRLRKTDFVGRYGGEEFAIVLPDTDATAAQAVLDEMRERFSQVRQHANDTVFTATFSCGFASFPRYTTTAAIMSAADRALYEAKRNGRNCVIGAQDEWMAQ